jgi:hypothetical protein
MGCLLLSRIEPTSAKRNPSENGGQNLEFPRCFVRYQSTYERTVSTSTSETNKSPANCIDTDERNAPLVGYHV